MLSSASSKFDLLPARPPTPPREISKAVDDAISFLDDSNEIDRLLNGPLTGSQLSTSSTAQIGPTLSDDIEDTSNATRKVGFSPHLIYYQTSEPEQSNSPKTHLDKKSTSVESAKPLKSILKSAHLAAPPTPEDLDTKLNSFSPEIPGSFAKMLQSVIHQLAGSSRSSRLDAYLALNGVLKAYEDVPDLQAMHEKMGQLVQFLARDIAWKTSDGRLDVNIITQAVKLTLAIVCRPKLAEALDDDFKTFLVDRSVLVLEQADMPKAIIKPHMYLLSQQRFRSAIAATGKADKIVTALKTIEDRCSGNSVIVTRLLIYRRLFQQVPAIMLARIRDWLEHIFHGMLSSVKDIRSRAIEACAHFGHEFGQHTHVSRALHDLFETEIEEGRTYGDFLIMRLEEMLEDKEIATCVPQIWSSVILFIRSKRISLERWPTFKLWLRLIQKCHNSSDITIRYHALLAWNKLVFAVMPDASTSDSLMNMLKIPITSGIERKGSDKYTQQVRQYALGSYYNLLYYAFRPGLSEAEHDTAWTTFVAPVLPVIIKSIDKGQNIACRVLQGLVNGDADVWDPEPAFYEDTITPAVLPKLNPRWVRSRLARILKLLEPILSFRMWSANEANAAIDKVWHDLMQSVADAGNQEVRTSNDLKEAIALLVNTFRRLWLGRKQSPLEADEGRWLQRFTGLVKTSINTLGAGHFTEDILQQTAEDVVEVAPTPSHRHAKPQGDAQSPLAIFFRLFCHPPSTLPIDLEYQNAISTVLNRLTSAKPGLQARLEVLSRCSQVLLYESDLVDQHCLRRTLWIALAENAIGFLKSKGSASDGQESRSVGHSLRHAVDILNSGFYVIANIGESDVIEEFYDAIHDSAKTSAGDAGVAIALIEPFAKGLSDTASPVPLEAKSSLVPHMLEKAVWPRTRQSMEQARKDLWGLGLAPNKSVAFDPFEHVYVLVNRSMTMAYNEFDALEASGVAWARNFCSSLMEFLKKSPPSLLGSALRKVQDGIVVWIADHHRKTGNNPDTLAMVRQTTSNRILHMLTLSQIQTAWAEVIRLLSTLPTKDSTLLKAVEGLLVAGFSSPHKDVVNATILFWNDTFGNEQSLEYPPKLEKVLRARIEDADISLPTFPDTNEEGVSASLPSFFESQSQMPARASLAMRDNASPRDTSHLSVSQPSARSPFFAARMSPLAQRVSMSSPARRSAPKSASSTPKPRLRHDDSQIQFAPIDSSPLPPEGESQHLTEHQQEVLARQHQDAQLFPDLSSSPLAQSTALPKPISKRLDFTSHTKQHTNNDLLGTPSGLPDGHGLMSDDLPSSPTPSSTKDVGQGAMDIDDEDHFDEPEQDPPSSPPRSVMEHEPHPDDDQMDAGEAQDYEVGPDETTVEVTDFAAEGRAVQNVPVNSTEVGSDVINVTSDLPSDTQLPTIQLQLEAAAASNEAPRIANSDEDAKKEAAHAVTNGNLIQDITRVEDSFVLSDAVDTERDSQSISGSQRSKRGGKKRKRSQEVVSTAKKHKENVSQGQVSLPKWNDDQQGEDGDVGEEIVVASSQRSSSPVLYTASPDQSPEKKPDAIEQGSSVVNADSQPNDMAPPAKRRPGRPRKSSTSLKRKASTLSDASTTDTPIPSSVAEGTPTKSLKRDDGQSPRKSGGSRPTEGVDTTKRVTRKNSSTVLVETKQQPNQQRNEANHTDLRSDAGDSYTDTPELQLQAEQAAVAPSTPARHIERPILTPKSILRRLRDALTDFKGMILGSQEEREFDDVLFELRKEVHEAGRRERG